MNEQPRTRRIREKKRQRRDELATLATSEEVTLEKIKATGYPIQSDTRGNARITFNKKSYYFGPFDSPDSYTLFGLWKAHLLETGEPIACATLRPIAEAALHAEPHHPPQVLTRQWFAAAVLLGLISIAAANYVGYRYYASFKAVEIDGIELTGPEIRGVRFVRGITVPREDSPNVPPELDPKYIEEARETLRRQAEERNSHATPRPDD